MANDKTNVPANTEWETVVEESPQVVVFDEVGDQFIGTYVGIEHVEPEDQPYDKDHKDYVSFDRYLFRDQEGTLVGVNESYKLGQQMVTKLKEGKLTRITLTKLIPSKKGNDLKDFKVEVAK